MLSEKQLIIIAQNIEQTIFDPAFNYTRWEGDEVEQIANYLNDWFKDV